MGYQTTIERQLQNFAAVFPISPKKTKKPAATDAAPPPANPLTALLTGVAARTQPALTDLEIQKTVEAFRSRITGLELDLSRLNPTEQSCLEAFTGDDWKTLHSSFAATGGAGIG